MMPTEPYPPGNETLRDQARKAAARRGAVMFVVAAGAEDNGAVVPADAFGTRSELAIFYVVYPPGWHYQPGAIRKRDHDPAPSPGRVSATRQARAH
jgi:hypothetical protein